MVAEYFANNSYVLGYELLNEPWAGDMYRHPDQLRPGESDGILANKSSEFSLQRFPIPRI